MMSSGQNPWECPFRGGIGESLPSTNTSGALFAIGGRQIGREVLAIEDVLVHGRSIGGRIRQMVPKRGKNFACDDLRCHRIVGGTADDKVCKWPIGM
jgi:hypothetical protein